MSYAFGGQIKWWMMEYERRKGKQNNVNYIWKSRDGCERSFLLGNEQLVVVEKKDMPFMPSYELQQVGAMMHGLKIFFMVCVLMLELQQR